MENQNNNTFYSVMYTVENKVQPLRHFQNRETLDSFLRVMEICEDAKCKITHEVCGTLYFTWLDKDGQEITRNRKHGISFPRYASLQRFG